MFDLLTFCYSFFRLRVTMMWPYPWKTLEGVDSWRNFSPRYVSTFICQFCIGHSLTRVALLWLLKHTRVFSLASWSHISIDYNSRTFILTSIVVRSGQSEWKQKWLLMGYHPLSVEKNIITILIWTVCKSYS